MAADWRAKDSVIAAQAKSAAAAGGLEAQPQVLAAQARQTVEGCIAQLAAAFGPVRFQVLDAYVARSAPKAQPRIAQPRRLRSQASKEVR